MRKIVTALFLLPVAYLHAQSTNEPCPRNQPVVAYHIIENKMYLFGGYCSSEKARLNDLWEFDGKRWKQIETENTPEPRSGHSMIYDPVRKGLIVFGGKNNDRELLNDLWLWNGAEWTLLSEGGPPARQSHRIVLDNEAGSLFLFGGSNTEGASLNDSWIFSDGKWRQLNIENPPPARLQHTLVYDLHRSKVILFGGFGRTDGEKRVYGDTWEWSKTNGWIFKGNNADIARDHHAMVYDKGSKRTILFGGYNQGYFGDTWSWDREKWNQIAIDGPSRAGKPGLMYNEVEKCVVLFGGGSSENMHLMDFWKFDPLTNSWVTYSD